MKRASRSVGLKWHWLIWAMAVSLLVEHQGAMVQAANDPVGKTYIPSSLPPKPVTSLNSQLIDALAKRDIAEVQRLVTQGADVNLRLPVQVAAPALPSVLMMAAGSGNVSFTRKVVELGAKPNPEGENGWTPLMLGVASGNVEVVRLLVGAGADVKRKFAGSISALSLAQGTGNREVEEVLRAAGADQLGDGKRFLVFQEGVTGTIFVPGHRVTLTDRRSIRISTPDGSSTMCTIGHRTCTYGIAHGKVTVWAYAGLVLVVSQA